MTKQVYDVARDGNCALASFSSVLLAKFLTHQLDNTFTLPAYSQLVDMVYKAANLTKPANIEDNQQLLLSYLRQQKNPKVRQTQVAQALRLMIVENLDQLDFEGIYYAFKSVLTNRLAISLGIPVDENLVRDDIFCNIEAIDQLINDFVKDKRQKIVNTIENRGLEANLSNLQNIFDEKYNLKLNQIFKKTVIPNYKSYLIQPSTMLGDIELGLLANLLAVNLKIYNGTIAEVNAGFRSGTKPIVWSLVDSEDAECAIELNHSPGHWSAILTDEEQAVLTQASSNEDLQIPSEEDAHVLVNNAVSDIFDALLNWAGNSAIRNQAVPKIFETVFNVTQDRYQMFKKAEPQERFGLFENYKKLRNQAINLIQPPAGLDTKDSSVDELVCSLNNLLKSPSL